ncbi:hypothetical protein Gorai_018535, partial [Gossypium raimondii]|nr:hypothetical protein [Gossypium raimondii]
MDIKKWVHESEKKDGLVTENFIKNYLKELDNLSNKLPEKREVIDAGLHPSNVDGFESRYKGDGGRRGFTDCVKKAQMDEEDRSEISAYIKDAK